MTLGGKFFMITFGCAANHADGEFMAGLLERAGFEMTGTQTDAGIAIINTCIVKTPTENRITSKIQELAKAGKPLVVAGCMPKTSQRKIERIAPNASIVGPDSITKIADAAKAALEGRKVIFVKDERTNKPGLPRVRRKKEIGIIPIAIGCLGACSYCATRFARGKLKSYSIDCIVAEAKSLVADGCKEIWLTSEDNSCYGLDIGTDLAELVEKVSAVPGDFTIRVGMMNPTHIRDGKLLEKLINAYKNPKVSKFLHVPVQSGSDEILKAMKRGYSVSDFEKIIAAFRAEIPSIYVSTDMIVGFPGETNEDFQKTVALIERTKPGKVNISKFGPRPGTEAALMQRLPDAAVSGRSKALHELVNLI